MLIHPSTQGVSVIGGQLAQSLGIPASNVRLKMDFIGGGFGSKFSIDRWGVECARISKLAEGKPGQNHARPQSRIDDRWHAPITLRSR